MVLVDGGVNTAIQTVANKLSAL